MLKARECNPNDLILKGRPIVWMMIGYFKTNRTLQEQYKYQDLESLKWARDEKLQSFYKQWKVVITGMAIPLDERILCDICAANAHEFDKMKGDDKLEVAH